MAQQFESAWLTEHAVARPTIDRISAVVETTKAACRMEERIEIMVHAPLELPRLPHVSL
jgi:hypothetical protein